MEFVELILDRFLKVDHTRNLYNSNHKCVFL